MDDVFMVVISETTAPTVAKVSAERVIEGNPETRTWNVEKTEDGQILSGIWEASEGSWRVDYDKWEFCHILSGHSILTQDGKAPRHVHAGDSFVVRPGFKGIWEVVETTRKLYVIRRAGL